MKQLAEDFNKITGRRLSVFEVKLLLDLSLYHAEKIKNDLGLYYCTPENREEEKEFWEMYEGYNYAARDADGTWLVYYKHPWIQFDDEEKEWNVQHSTGCKVVEGVGIIPKQWNKETNWVKTLQERSHDQ